MGLLDKITVIATAIGFLAAMVIVVEFLLYLFGPSWGCYYTFSTDLYVTVAISTPLIVLFCQMFKPER